MVQENNITKNHQKAKKWSHLTYPERVVISALLSLKYSQNQIADIISRGRKTIQDEVKRGTVQVIKQRQIKPNGKVYVYFKIEYSADLGQAKYEKARKNCGISFQFPKSTKFCHFADACMLRNNWSPDTVIGFVKKRGLFKDEFIPCTSTLYAWIDAGFMKTKNLDLLLKVGRRQNKKRSRENKKVLGDSIEKRPDYIDKREEFGHWEIDTVHGKRGCNDGVLLTLIERKTRFELIFKLTANTAECVNKKIEGLLENVSDKFKEIFKTITGDNGSEFSELFELLKGVTNVYFTHPFSSWEKGTNENHNGIIRRYLPKGTIMNDVDDRTINRIQNWMNIMPRKILEYQTPLEAFKDELRLIA